MPRISLFALALLICPFAAIAADCARGQARATPPSPPAPDNRPITLRIGIIGCDTSHVGAFTKVFNDPKSEGDYVGMRVVAAFPGGSKDIPDSANRVGKFTEDERKLASKLSTRFPSCSKK